MNVFCLVTARESLEHAERALRSLVESTPLERSDRILLTAAHGSRLDRAGLAAAGAENLSVVEARNRAQAVNRAFSMADALGADLFVLDADDLFTPGWFAPLQDRQAGIVCANPGVQQARAGYLRVAGESLGCARIPAAVRAKVGTMDERFGDLVAGDLDYCVRAWLAGIPVEMALASPVSRDRTASRANPAEGRLFREKWGEALAYAILADDWNLFLPDPTLTPALRRRQFQTAIAHLRGQPALAPHVERQAACRFGAVCCLYDDDAWLEPTYEAAYEACDGIWFLLGHRPWNGGASDQAALLAKLESLPDPAGKVRIVRGDWPTEAAERNAGLELLEREGFEYCLVLDADEIHHPAQLAAAMALARENPQIDCWRMRCLTYWKSASYRVEPPEPDPAVVFLRVGAGRFVQNRMPVWHTDIVIPMETAVIHHMSYARSDAQVARKIATFGHAHQVVPGWYERVWRGWDRDRTIENLNPCWPAAYRRIVMQPAEALPPTLRRRVSGP
jgi:hypothetical protein